MTKKQMLSIQALGIRLLLAGGIEVAVLLLLHVTVFYTECWTLYKTSINSPDGKWTVLMEETACEGWGGPVATTIDDDVYLTSPDHPEIRVNMLGVDTGGNLDKRPHVRWSSSKVLAVAVSDMYYVTIFKTDYRGIHLDIQFDHKDGATQ